ncbi:MAG: Nickel-dependent superoxide dismutase, partial [uncultured Blastococcus sp.]
ASHPHVLRPRRPGAGGHRALRPPLRRVRPGPGPHRGGVGQGHPGEVPGQRGPGLPHPRHPDQGAAVGPGQAPPVGALDRLLQAPALREVPPAARAVQQGHQAGRRGRRQGQHGPRRGPEAARLHRRDRQDLLGDEGRRL